MAEEEQKPADMSQESIDYENKREFRSDQSEGRLSLNDTLQSEYGSEGGQVSEGSSEQTRKRSRSRLSRWNKNSEDSCIEKNDNEKSIYTEEEFTDDIIDIPKEDRICSEKNKDLNVKEDSTSEATNPNKIGDSNQSIENDSNISHTIVDCPHALKVLTEDEPIVLEMKDTLKTQLEEVSSVLKAQMEKISDVLQIEKAHMEKISDELQIGALESNTLQDETLNPSLGSESNTSISLEDSTQYTEDKKYTVYKRFVSLPSFDESSLENGIQVVETNSNNVTQILNTSQNTVNESQVQNLSETVEFSITSDTQTSEALQILDKSGEVTSEAQNMNSIEVLRSIKDKVMQELDTFMEITSETQVQESLEKDVISDSTNIDSTEVMQVLDNSAEVTDIKNQVQISLEKDVISDPSSINLKKEMQVLDNSLEVDNEVQVPKPLEIAEISETLGKCLSEPHIHNEEQTLDITDKVISKHDDIDNSECIIHVESSETVIDDLYSKLNTESMEDPHLKKKKSKLQSFDKQAGAKIHSFGESVGESGKDVINLVQKKVTQSTSKLKQRVSADISETTEIQRVNESDSLDNSGTDNVSTNLDTKKKQSKVHEWNKRAGAQIHALGESVDDAGRVIVKSLQKTRDVSTHREVKTTHNPVYEAESVVSVESSDLPQKEKGDNVVTEMSTDKAVEVGKGEIQVDVSEVDAGQLEVTSKNKPSKLHNWDKQTGAQIHALSESIEGGGKEIIKKFRKSMILTTKAEENNHQEDAACITDNSKNITSDDEILQENLKDDTNDTVLESKSKENVEPSVKRKSTLDQWSKQAGARVHAMGETVGEGSHEALKKVQKGLSHSATLIKDKLPSVGSTQPSEDKLSSVESTQPSEAKLPSVESTQPSEEITAEPIIEIRKSTEKDNMSQKSSNVDNWNKRTGAQIYHMTENVGDRGRDVIKKVKRSVSRPRSMAVDVETEDAPAEENNVMNISMEGSVSSQKKKSGFKEWDKRTGAKIFKVTESVGDRGRDVIKSVRKNISRPASVSEDMDANKDDQISTISKASETSQERKKKSKFSEWNKRTGAQVYHMTETTSKGVKTGINTAVHNPAVDKVRSGITAAANSPTVEHVARHVHVANKHGSELVQQVRVRFMHKGDASEDRLSTVDPTPYTSIEDLSKTGKTNRFDDWKLAATERGRVLVRQATENLKRRTASMPRGASAPGTEGNLDYSSTLPRHRGGSSSPSRGGTLKRLSANLPPLPPQLRKVFPGRERAQYPRDPSPSKPSRRQGPVGRTWVKVYDDISYVDDKDKNREEDYPALANRMGPTVLPNAKPLPTPPTPPPPRARHQNPPAHDLAVDNEIASIDLEWQMETRGRNNNRFKGRREKRSSTPLGREYEDEGDALRRSARLDAPEGTDEDDYIIPENLKPEKPVRGIKVYEDVIFKRKQQDQEKNRQQEDELQEQKILEKQIIVNDEVKIEEPKKPQRGVKVYEDIIFKRQQEKEKQLVDEPKVYQEMEEQKQPEIISKDKEEVLLPVQKPQRGIKVYEGIIFKKQQETEKHIQEDKKSEETVKEVSAVEDKPPKPQRGIKVYDKIEFKNTQNTQYTFETNIDESVSEVTVDESSTSSEVTVIDGSLKEDVPFKPVRGNKIYASLLVKTHEASGQVLVSEVKETYREKPKLKTKEIEHTTVSSKPTPTEPVTPRLDELNLELQSSHLSLFEAPTLGVARMDTVMAYETPVEAQKLEKLIPVTPKVEAEPKLEETDKPKEKVKDKVNVTTKVEEVRKVEIVNKAGEAPIVEVTTKVIDMAEIGENIRKTNDIETVVTKPEENTDISDGSNPPYARVHKETGGVGPLRSLTPAEGYDEDGPAPPIPPKKVGIRTITPTASFDVPPRPDRHLKPTHLKPARGQKNRRPQINGEVLPSRPQRGNKLYADVEPAKPKRNSKVIRIEDVALLKDGLQELTMPPKPTRNLQRPNEAPPRRKRSGKENELVYEDVPDAVTARLTVALDHPAPLEISTDFYENIELKDGAPVHPDRSRMRGRPPPPPPPKKGKIQKNYQDRQPEQDSQPSGGGGSSSNGEVGKLGSGAVDQGGSSVSDSIVPPADVSSTTTAASAAITGGTTSQLETDIDHNLKNIESSFATLDDVLQSLKSYSRESSRNRRVILGESDKERAKLELEVNKRLEAIHSAEVVGVDYQNIEVKSGDVLIKKASVSENDYTEEKSQLIQLPDKIEVKPESNQIKSTETDQIKVAVSIEETQTVEKTQLLEKSNNIKAEIYLPEKAVVKDVKNEETSEVKIAVSIEETQTVEKTQLLEKSNNIKSEAFAELKDVKDEETEEVKIAVTVQELQTEEKTSEVSSEVVKAHAEVKDVKDEEKEEVKVAVTVVELQTEGKTSEVKSGEESKQVEDPVTVQTSSDEVNSRAKSAISEGEQQSSPSDSKASEEQPDAEGSETAILQAGVADIASRLEGIRCALESVIVNYPAPSSSTPPPSNLPLTTSTTSPVPPPPHSTPIISPATPSIETQPATTDTINTNLQVHTNTSLCPSSPTFPRASSPRITTSYIPYIHSIAASIQSTAGNLQYEGYESPVSSPEPPKSPSSPPALYHSSSAHALEALDKSFKTFNDALEALEDPSLLNNDTPSTNSYKPPSILHLLSPSPSKASVTTVQSSDKHPTPSDKIQESPINRLGAVENSSSSRFSTATSITDKLISELQVQQPKIKDSSLSTHSGKTTQEISPQALYQQSVEQHLLEQQLNLKTSEEELIKLSVQTQQTQVELAPPTQLHVKQPSSEQPQINQTTVEPSISQSSIKQTSFVQPQTLQTEVEESIKLSVQAQQTKVEPAPSTQLHVKQTSLEQPQIHQTTIEPSIAQSSTKLSVQAQQTEIEPAPSSQLHVKQTSLEQPQIHQTTVEPSIAQSSIKQTLFAQPQTLQTAVEESIKLSGQAQQTEIEPAPSTQLHVKQTSLEEPQIHQTTVEPSIAQSSIKQTLSAQPETLQTTVEDSIKLSAQAQQTQVKPSPTTQLHVKQTSVEQSKSHQTSVEPSIAQSSIKATLLEPPQTLQSAVQDLPTIEQPTLKKSSSSPRFGLTASPSSDNLLPWVYLGPSKTPSPTEYPSCSGSLLSPKLPAPRSTSPVFGFTKVDPDSDSIPWQYLGPITSSSNLPDLKPPSPTHVSIQSSSISAVVTSSSSCCLTESKPPVESSSSIPISSSHSSSVTIPSHVSHVTSTPDAFGSPFPTSSPKPTARFTFGLPSVHPGAVPSGNPAPCTSNIQATGQPRGSSSTTLEDSSAASASQQNQTEPEC